MILSFRRALFATKWNTSIGCMLTDYWCQAKNEQLWLLRDESSDFFFYKDNLSIDLQKTRSASGGKRVAYLVSFKSLYDFLEKQSITLPQTARTPSHHIRQDYSKRSIDVIVSANDQRFDQQMFVLTATRFAGLPQSTVKFFVVQTGDEQGDFCVLITFIESCPHQKGTWYWNKVISVCKANSSNKYIWWMIVFSCWIYWWDYICHNFSSLPCTGMVTSNKILLESNSVSNQHRGNFQVFYYRSLISYILIFL